MEVAPHQFVRLNTKHSRSSQFHFGIESQFHFARAKYLSIEWLQKRLCVRLEIFFLIWKLFWPTEKEEEKEEGLFPWAGVTVSHSTHQLFFSQRNLTRNVYAMSVCQCNPLRTQLGVLLFLLFPPLFALRWSRLFAQGLLFSISLRYFFFKRCPMPIRLKIVSIPSHT